MIYGGERTYDNLGILGDKEIEYELKHCFITHGLAHEQQIVSSSSSK